MHAWQLNYNILILRHILEFYSNVTDSAELVHNNEQSLELADILPIKARSYDKNRAPKLLGQPTVVYFHVTVLSIDSINEESMTYVTDIFLAQRYLAAVLFDKPSIYFLFSPFVTFFNKLARSEAQATGKHERGISNFRRGMAPLDLAARLLF